MTTAQAMDTAIDALKRELLAAKVEVASSAYPLKKAKASAELALDQAGKWIDFLQSDARDQVLAGSRSYQSWVEMAEKVYAQIAELRGFSAKWNLSGTLRAVGEQLAENLAKGAGKLTDGLPLVAGFVVVVLILIVAIKVT